MPVTQHLISDVPSLEALRAEWVDLVARCPAATVFQRPEWLIPWWRYSGSGEMWTLAFRSGNQLVGLLCMFAHEWDGRRQVTLMGNGVSDDLDLLAEPEFAFECADAAFQYLRNCSHEWDLCHFQDVPGHSPLLHRTPDDLAQATCDTNPCSGIDLPRLAEVFHDSLPHGLRRNLRRYGERLRSEQNSGFETYQDDNSGELLTALFRLHGDRWRSKGESGMLDGRERFFRSVTPVLASSNLLRIHCLRIDGAIVAILYQLRDKARAYGYITGFDPAFDRYSPGALLLEHAIREAIGEGASVWDFLRGGERYKFQWGARERRKFNIQLFSPAE